MARGGEGPAQALRGWLAPLRYVTPTLQAAAIADMTTRSDRACLTSMTDEELSAVIVDSQGAAALMKQGVKRTALFALLIDRHLLIRG